MRTVADVIDAVSTERRSPSGDVYRHLAPVYDVFARTIDYDAYASFIRTHEPEDTTAIGLFACGTGRLLATVADRYEIAVGFDRSSAMLSQATARTDAPTVVADLRTCVVPGASTSSRSSAIRSFTSPPGQWPRPVPDRAFKRVRVTPTRRRVAL
ncbi:class I SAM-dependent methyltransferase [Natrialba swarupiae]|nr:class I SAM-dependent methyltransferase [Natrialba swarupiae]